MDRPCRGGVTPLQISMFLLGALGCTALGCTADRGASGLAPALPAAGAELDPLLQQRILAQVAVIERAPADAVAHGTLGLIYEANELWEPARRAYENAAALAPQTPEWLYHAALCQAETGDASGGEQKLAEVARRAPRFAPGRHQYGLALLSSGDIPGAERELLAVKDLAGTLPEAHTALAELRNTEGRFAEGLLLAERALELDPASLRARYLRGVALRGIGRAEEAAADLAAGADAKRQRIPDPLMGQLSRHYVGRSVQVGQGADLVEAGRYDEAIALLRAALVERPEDEAILNNLSVAYQRKGDNQAAYDLLIAHHKKDRDHLPTLLNLSEALWALRRFDEELGIAQHAVRVHPQSGSAHFALAKALFALQRFPEGIDACETSIRLDPTNGEVYSAAGEGLLRIDALDRAEPHLRRAIELVPNTLPPRANLCALLIRRGRLAEAEVALRELTRRAPDHPQVRILQDRFVEAQRAAATGKPAG